MTVFLFCLPSAVIAADDKISLFADSVLQDSGFIRFLLPRFSLKTGVQIDVQTHVVSRGMPGGADIVLTYDSLSGAAVQVSRGFSGYGKIFQVFSYHGADASNERVQRNTRFVDWILSETGQRTIEQFSNDGKHPFSRVANTVAQVAAPIFTGNAIAGESLSYTNCGRCHVISARNRMKGLGSTPSFPLLRTFEDWQYRFESFYALNPHPSFSQVIGVTAPFNRRLPPPISPLELTQENLEDIVAFVATIKPADLGAPIVHQ